MTPAAARLYAEMVPEVIEHLMAVLNTRKGEDWVVKANLVAAIKEFHILYDQAMRILNSVAAPLRGEEA